jgi:hypothetical protein
LLNQIIPMPLLLDDSGSEQTPPLELILLTLSQNLLNNRLSRITDIRTASTGHGLGVLSGAE